MIMNPTKEVHTSDRIAFKRCRRKWNLGSYMRQNMQPIRINDKLWLGTGVHFGLAEYYENKIHPTEAFDTWCESEILEKQKINPLWQEQLDLINEARALGSEMLAHYYDWCREEDPKWFVKVVATESSFKLPILDPDGNDTGYVYAGRIDGIVEDEFGLYWLLEHKTAKAFTNDKLPLDEQCGSYIWAAQQIYGKKLEGVIYNQLKKSVPTVPAELKKGGLSQNKQMSTTWQCYMNALDEYYGGRENVPMADYKDFLQYLHGEGNKFFDRVKVYRSQKEIKDIGLRIYYELQDMMREDLHLYPNPNRDCGWDCDFRSVCLSMNDGSDYQYMLDNLFQVRPPSDEVERVADE